MEELTKKLYEYADTFGDNFPTFLYPNATPIEIITIINECIKKGEPIKTDYADNIY